MKSNFRIYIIIILFLSMIFTSSFHVFALNHIDSNISIIFDNQNNEIDNIINQTELKIKYQFYSINNKDLDNKKEIILNALDSYPEDFLKNNITKIFIFSELNINNDDYICEHFGKNLLMRIDSDTFDKNIEDTIHSEISEIIFENNSDFFDIDKWMKLLPKDFTYSNQIKSLLIKNKKNLTPNNSLFQVGFINDYSKTSIKADFSQLCRYLFLKNNSLHKALTNNELL